MLDTMRREYYWLDVGNEIFTTVQDCHQLVWKKPSEKHRHQNRDISSKGLEFVAVDILGSVPKMSNKNEFVLVMSDYFLN